MEAQQPDRRILAAAREVLESAGWSALDLDDVARRGGVSPAAVRSRWESTHDLAMAVYADLLDREVPVTDTGDLRADLTAYLRRIDAVVTAVSRADRSAPDPDRPTRVAALVAAAALHDLPPGMRGLGTRRIELAVGLVERAAGRGELRPGTDAVHLLDQLAGPYHYRVLITGPPVDETWLANLAGAVVTRAGRDH